MAADCRAPAATCASSAPPGPPVAPPPSIHFEDYPREVGKREIRVSDAAARIANALHLHLRLTASRRQRHDEGPQPVGGGLRRRCGSRRDQWNESPHAHEPVALGLSIVKPCFSMVSTKSIIAPLR